MRITIIPTTYLSAGSLTVKAGPGTDLESLAVRVSRQRTIDGGSVITHYGCHDNDRTLTINCQLSQSDNIRLRDMLQNDTEFALSTPEGVFIGAIESREGAGGNVAIRFLVSERIDPVFPDFTIPPMAFIISFASAFSAYDDAFGEFPGVIRFGISGVQPYRTAIRFPATLFSDVVSSAFAKVTSGTYGGYCSTRVRFHDADDSPTLPTSYDDFDNFPKTSASVLWNFTTYAFPKESPDLSIPLNAVISRPGFAGASVMMLCEGEAVSPSYLNGFYASILTLEGVL